MDLTVESYLADPSGGNAILKRIWDEIPLLDDVPNHQLVDGRLFRFRGMVQDMPNPVYYYQNYTVVNTLTGQTTVRCGKYRDGLVCHENEKLLLDSEGNVSEERRVYYCVNVPALNDWARSGRRVPENRAGSTSGAPKRPADMDVDTDEVVNDGHKRQCVNVSRVTQSGTVTNLHCPITSPRDGACVIHVYDSPGDSVKVNDVVDVVGFVYVSSVDQDEVDVPPSLAPRLHAVAFQPFTPSLIAQTASNVASLRADLHLALTQLFLGDHLAADYVICHMLSNVYGRRDVVVLGKYSLNLFNVPLNPAYVQGIYDIVSLLVPKSHLFPMTLENMNTSDLVPMKDYETNRLKSGILQLSDRTHFVIDETKLQPGKLGERGVKNVQVLNTLLSEQTVNYDFKFYSVPFPMNIPVLVLSEGKSLLQCDALVKLVPAESPSGSISETINAVKSFLREPLLSNVRTYLAAAATQEFTLPEDLTQAVQEDFVTMRQSDARITPEEMHAHLVLARLLSLSLGHTSMTKEVWDRATELERLRRARLSN